MRILHVVSSVDDRGSAGGDLAVALHQSAELRRRGHDVLLLGGWRGPGPAPLQVEGVPAQLFRVYPVAPGLGPGGRFSPALGRWIRHHAADIDVAHVHLARDLVPLSIAGTMRRAGLRYVVQAHGDLGPDSGPLSTLITRRPLARTLRAADQVFVVTPDERDALVRLSGTAATISLLPVGVTLPDRVPVRPSGSRPDVVFLGRLSPRRRVMAFAAAAERLLADGIEATFSVIGPDGGDLRSLNRFLAQRPALREYLRYEGAMGHRAATERLHRADLYVLPSVDGHPYPMSLLEALAGGVPSICTTSCGLAGTLARHHAAIVANPTDDALYGAMRRMLLDPEARAQLSIRAAATVASEFAMSAVAEVLEQEYAGQPGGRDIDLRTLSDSAGASRTAGARRSERIIDLNGPRTAERPIAPGPATGEPTTEGADGAHARHIDLERIDRSALGPSPPRGAGRHRS